jgi:hypothetical protein
VPLCVFRAPAINGVLTGVVDASDANVGLGGYGFTANPNQYFTLLHHHYLRQLI